MLPVTSSLLCGRRCKPATVNNWRARLIRKRRNRHRHRWDRGTNGVRGRMENWKNAFRKVWGVSRFMRGKIMTHAVHAHHTSETMGLVMTTRKKWRVLFQVPRADAYLNGNFKTETRNEFGGVHFNRHPYWDVPHIEQLAGVYFFFLRKPVRRHAINERR